MFVFLILLLILNWVAALSDLGKYSVCIFGIGYWNYGIWIFAGLISQRCRAGDSACLASTITSILHTYPSGIPQLGINSLDPCFVGNEKTDQGSGAVAIKLSLFEGWVHGWSNGTVTTVV